MEAGLFSEIREALAYGFMQRALIAGSIVAGTCGLLGVFLVLRRFAMLGEGLAHFSFGAIGLALALGFAPFHLAVPLAIVAAQVIQRLSRTSVHSDAAIGMVSAAGIAVGVLLASIGSGSNVDLMSYLFGDILSISRFEMYSALALSLVVVGVTVLNFGELFALTFDPVNAKVLGVNTTRMESVLLIAAAITVVLGIKVVGTLLVSALIIIPAVSALQIARGFLAALILAALQAVISVLIGILAAFAFEIPPASAIVIVNLILFTLAWLAAKLLKL